MKDTEKPQRATKRPHERHFPVKRIESLINLAVKHRLRSLKVGDIEIIPDTFIQEPKVKEPAKTSSFTNPGPDETVQRGSFTAAEDRTLFGPDAKFDIKSDL